MGNNYKNKYLALYYINSKGVYASQSRIHSGILNINKVTYGFSFFDRVVIDSLLS